MLKLLENFGKLTVLVRKVAIELNSETNVNFGEVVIYLMRLAQMLRLAYFQPLGRFYIGGEMLALSASWAVVKKIDFLVTSSIICSNGYPQWRCKR